MNQKQKMLGVMQNLYCIIAQHFLFVNFYNNLNSKVLPKNKNTFKADT